jgi:hypothetical protein
MAQDPNGLFEEDANGQLVMTELGRRFKEMYNESLAELVEDRMENMIEAVDQYFQQEITSYIEESVEDSVAELRKLCLLAVSTIGGQDKDREFVRKVAELARTGALSSASGAWAQSGPPDASANRDSVRGGGVSTRKESVDDEETEVEIEQARAVFREAAEGLTGAETSRLMSLTENMEFDGDEDKLRRDLKVIRESYFGSAATSSYVRAISRTVLKG